MIKDEKSKLDLLTVEELANKMRLAPDTIRKWTRERRIPYLKLGYHLIRFEPERVLRWLRTKDQI